MLKRAIILATLVFLTSCGVKTQINENGRIASGKLKNGQKAGNWTITKDGKIFGIGRYKNGKEDGIWKYYYPNGSLHQKGKFINGKGNGLWKYYYSDGNFVGEGEQINDKQIDLWKWYHKNGKIYTERFYEDGKLLEIKSCFDKDGKKLDCGKVVNGNGYMLSHDLENYENQPSKFEFENGNIK